MSQENQAIEKKETTERKPTDVEYNFRALEAKLKEEREARLLAERKAQELQQLQNTKPQDDDYDEPYIDQKYLKKQMSTLEHNLQQKYEKIAEEKARQLIEMQRQEDWLARNSDFHEVLKHAQTFADQDPELAETILKMPDTFERQKLVYRTIKSMNLHKAKEESIQTKIDSNRRSPYYQPSSVGSAPYQNQSDFSPSGQKLAYQKMKEMQSKMR